MGRTRHDEDLYQLAMHWASTRRELLGLRSPRLQSEFIGAIRCSLRNVQRQGDGAGAFTDREQFFPEVYVGDAFLLNLAFKAMPPEIAAVREAHYVLPKITALRKSEMLYISIATYMARLAEARAFARGFLNARDAAARVDGAAWLPAGSVPSAARRTLTKV
jgi:hypothetical protein